VFGFKTPIVGRLKPNCDGTNDLSKSDRLMAAIKDQMAVDGALSGSSVLHRGPESYCKVSTVKSDLKGQDKW
jgi:hypothetical protein